MIALRKRPWKPSISLNPQLGPHHHDGLIHASVLALEVLVFLSVEEPVSRSGGMVAGGIVNRIQTWQATCWVALFATLALGGCGSSGPTTPNSEDLVYSGVLETNDRETRPLLLVDEGTVRFTLTKADPLLIQLPPGFDEAFFSIGVGIGQASEGDCSVTFGTSLLVNESLTVFVSDVEHCLVVFDDGSLPPDAKIEWEVVVTDVEN